MRTSSKCGFTLVEQVIGIAILCVMFGAVGLASLQSQRAFQSANAQDALQARARRTVDRIADEVEMAVTSGSAVLVPNPVPPFGSSTLDFATPVGLAGMTVLCSDTTRIAFQYSATDPNDGVDNDGNGMIDDGQVVVTRHFGLANEQSFILVRGVCEYLDTETPNLVDDNGNGLIDEKGLSFDISGKTLTIRLTLGQLDARGQLEKRTVQTSVRLRN